MPDSDHYGSKGTHYGHRLHHPRIIHWLIRLGPFGVLAVAAADATPLPSPIPASTDLLLLWLISRGASPWFLVPAAAAGSIVGGYITWHLGVRGGRPALNRRLPESMRGGIYRWIERHPVLTLCVPPILPPPLPLIPFIFAAGALGISLRRFITVFGIVRTVRYTLVAWMAILYGRPLFHWCAHTLRAWSSSLK